MAIGTAVALPTPAYAADDYPAQWKNAAPDTVFDSWGEYNRECVSFAASALHNRNGFDKPFYGGNAIDWVSRVQSNATWKAAYPINTTPAVGAIAWWGNHTWNNGYGHVAYVTAVNGSNVTLEEYNFTNPYAWDTRTIAASSADDFIHFADLPGSGGDTSSQSPNLFEIQHDLTNSGMTEIRGLNASTNYTTWLGGWVTPDGLHGGDAVDYGMADANGDGVQDIYKMQYGYTNSGMTEVKVFDGKQNFQQWVGGWSTADPYHTPGTVHYAVGNFDGDARPDVFVIPTNNTPSGHVEVKVLTGASNYKQWAGGWVTPDGWHNASGVDFVLSSCGATSGRPNLYEIQHSLTNSGMTEVKEFNGADYYRSFIGGWPTLDGLHDGDSVNYTAGGCNPNGKPNIYEVIHQYTNSGMTEVRELNGATNYSTWVGGWPTPDGWHSGSGIDYVMPAF